MEIYTPPESKPLIALSSSPTLVSSSSAGSPSPPPPAAPAPTHLSQFFSAYPAFKFDPVAPASQQFDALKCKYHREWDTDDKKQAETGYARAMSFTFTELYGKDADILENWHKLCHAVRIHPPPDTIEECRTAMYDAHVNLIDLADAARTGQQVRRFPSEEALSVYSRATNKILKLHLATPSPLLRALLRKIFNPRSNNDRRPRKRPRWEVEDSESE
ncbi:hypothetical protein C8F01DRAFT_982532 [Mycena amicta]|nr:hypothetical protein C8F01DRAFT_982532 [Mycena amicta]